VAGGKKLNGPTGVNCDIAAHRTACARSKII